MAGKAFDDGHFYSPIVAPDEATRDAERIWPQEPLDTGLDFDDAGHLELLTEVAPRYLGDYDYPEQRPEGAAETAFYTRNSQFSWLDSRMLFCLLRHLRPARMIEVGSGFSSLLAADVNVRYLDRSMELTCVEPYPREFLRGGVDGTSELLVERVQDLPLEYFDRLQAGDVLFIDSSHVAKTGSDICFLHLRVLPRLRAGVWVHVHDIFLPFDYPKAWVLEEGRSWNEQYLVHALLLGSRMLRIRFGSAYAFHRYPEELRALLGGKAYGGGSLWIEKTG